MKKMLPLFLLPVLEAGAETQAEVPTWTTLATQSKPVGRDFEKEFRLRHFYLVSQGFCTRVPRESILHLPEQYRDSIAEKPRGRQVGWIEFLGANGSWLRHQDVTWPQVLGKVTFSEAVLRNIKNDVHLVIATYQGGPVTVLSASVGKKANEQPNGSKK